MTTKMTAAELIAEIEAAAAESPLGLETPVQMADPPSQAKGESYPIRDVSYDGWEGEPDTLTIEGAWD